MSQKKHGHVRIARVSRVLSDSRIVQKSVTLIIYLGPLPSLMHPDRPYIDTQYALDGFLGQVGDRQCVTLHAPPALPGHFGEKGKQ